jgi:hypothetical protein
LERLLLAGYFGLVEKILVLKTNYSPYAGYLFGHPLGYSTEGGFSRLDCGGLATVGVGGQGYFLPGTWVAI